MGSQPTAGRRLWPSYLDNASGADVCPGRWAGRRPGNPQSNVALIVLLASLRPDPISICACASCKALRWAYQPGGRRSGQASGRVFATRIGGRCFPHRGTDRLRSKPAFFLIA